MRKNILILSPQPKTSSELIKIVKLINTSRLYRDTKLLIGIAVIIISFVSFIRSIKIIKNLEKGDAHIGNEPYLAAAILTLIICIAVLIWGFRSLTSVIKNGNGKHGKPGDWEFDNYEKVEKALVQNQVPSYRKTGSKKIEDKDLTFVIKFLSFLGIVILLLLVKISIPDEFFWKFNLTSGYFSFPLDITTIIAAAAGLRTASFFLHTRGKKQEAEVSKTKERIKGEGDPYMLAPVIEEALCKIQYKKNPNIPSRFGFSATEGVDKKTGRTERKLFIETHPRSVAYEPHPIVLLYLLFAIILSISGFFLMTKLPPDNISVLTVPTIAFGYLWNIVKGGILVFCGLDLLAGVSGVYKTDWFESVMVYVEVKGIYRKIETKVEDKGTEFPGTGGAAVRSDYNIGVYTTKLLTEIYYQEEKKHKSKKTVKKPSNNKEISETNPGVEEIRHIIRMTTDKNTKKAGELVIGAIKKFEKEENHER